MKIEQLYQQAHDSGLHLAQLRKPIPFTYNGYENPVFTGEDPEEENSRELKTFIEPEGCCGFVSLLVDRHQELAKYLLDNKSGKLTDDKRMVRWSIEYNDQSLDRQLAYAVGFMQVLANYGVFSQVEGRID